MKYFGTDGIRGKAYIDINKDLAFKVGRSMELLDDKLIVIGRDTRESGEMIVNALKKGIIEAGLEVLDLGIVATPILGFYSIYKDCHGIMVTASHNPYQDNGIKVFNRGRKTTVEEESKIEAVIDGLTVLKNKQYGKELAYENPLGNYFSLYENFICKSKLNIALDLANGATVNSAKYVFDKISDNISYIGDQPDGMNINLNVGSTHIDNLAKYVVENSFDIGFSFDGDGDRLLAVDKTGRVINGDLIIYLIAIYLQEKGLLNNNQVVLTKMSNIGIIQALETRGINVIQTDVGDKYVVEAMHNFDAMVGGENSGHVINRNLFISGDGVLNAAYIIKILEEKQVGLADLVEDVTFYPDKLVNLKNIDKTIAKDQRIIDLVESIKLELGNQGKVLVRPSGTEQLIRVSASAKTEAKVDEIIDQIINEIKMINKERES